MFHLRWKYIFLIPNQYLEWQEVKIDLLQDVAQVY
jgi:hypothetical protein